MTCQTVYKVPRLAQVAKALLDSAPRGAAPDPPLPMQAGAWAPEPVLALLRFREAALTAEIAGAIAAAAKSAAPRGKAAAAAAGGDAFEANLDRVLALGWAHVDRIAFEVRRLCEEAGMRCLGPLLVYI